MEKSPVSATQDKQSALYLQGTIVKFITCFNVVARVDAVLGGCYDIARVFWVVIAALLTLVGVSGMFWWLLRNFWSFLGSCYGISRTLLEVFGWFLVHTEWLLGC